MRDSCRRYAQVMSPIHGRNNGSLIQHVSSPTGPGKSKSPRQSFPTQQATGKGLHGKKQQGLVSASAGFLAFYRGHNDEEDLLPNGPSRVARQDTRSPHLLITETWDNRVSPHSPHTCHRGV